MPYEPKLIAPFQTGLQTDVKPWLAPEDAFAELENAFVFRGRVKKKPGFAYSGEDEYQSRLKIKLGTTTSGGFFSTSFTSLLFASDHFVPGQIFKIGEEIFTIPAFKSSDQSIPLLMSGDATSAVIDKSGVNPVISFSTSHDTKDVYFFPSHPVMGIVTKELKAINVNQPVVFDTHYAYTFDQQVGWTQLGTKRFAGDETSFWSTVNFYGDSYEETFFYAVNGKEENGISYLEENSTNWETFKPLIKLEEGVSDQLIHSCKIITSFANRLFCLNTFEGKSDKSDLAHYPYRIRWGPIGERASGEDVANNPEWNSFASLGAGWLEIPTRETITAVEFLRGRMIVFCERSMWMIVLIGRAVLKDGKKEKGAAIPFALKQLNSSFGAESINGTLFFDNSLLAMTQKGIIQTDTVNVKRIDIKIPEKFEQIERENKGYEKVYAFRDILNELIYWGFPSDSTFPNKMLCWNYALESWSLFDFSFTAIGDSYEFKTMSWANISKYYPTWADWKQPWGSHTTHKKDHKIMVGNQQGFLFYLDNYSSEHKKELSIQNMNPTNQQVEIRDHNLSSSDFVEVAADGILNLPPIVRVNRIDEHTIKFDNVKFTGSYVGDGYLTRVPRINILTKEWTFGFEAGKRFYFPYADFLLGDSPKIGDPPKSGEISVTPLLNTGDDLQLAEKALLGKNIIVMQEEGGLGSFTQKMRWHRLFLQSHQSGIQFRIWLSDEQMLEERSAKSSFELHAFLFYISVEGRLVT